MTLATVTLADVPFIVIGMLCWHALVAAWRWWQVDKSPTPDEEPPWPGELKYPNHIALHHAHVKANTPSPPPDTPPQPCQPTMNLLEPETRSICDWLRNLWRWWHHEQPWPHA